jgi:hypothetical protein
MMTMKKLCSLLLFALCLALLANDNDSYEMTRIGDLRSQALAHQLPWDSCYAAGPRRVILLRHGEKSTPYELTPTGELRAQALAHQFLGAGGSHSLFSSKDKPVAFLSMTLHTIELITPAAATWSLPTVAYSYVPSSVVAQDEVLALNKRTQEAAYDLFHNSKWNGRTVVICWEHDHIASEKLEQQFPGELVTWRQLLHLEKLPEPYRSQVPESWEGDNYDYFWIITFRGTRPISFESKLQAFDAPYESVPQNLWGDPEVSSTLSGN